MKHLTAEQRYKIECYIGNGFTQKYIALKLKVSPSTICRELRRNADERNGQYRATLAISKCEKRHKTKAKHIRCTPEVTKHVFKYLDMDYSPEQIVGFSKRHDIPCVSHETIYQMVLNDTKNGGDIFTHLRRRRKKRQKRGNKYKSRGIIPNRRDISERPNVVEEKKRVGDLEMDLVIGKDHQGAILTINDRATGMVKIELLEGKTAEEVAAAVLGTLKGWKSFLHTITTDNGREFAWHEKIAKKLNIDYFFARPYHSWERGANENFNGLLRQYFPKGSDFSLITKEELKKVEKKLNNRPRKRFGFLSPIEVFDLAMRNAEEIDIAFIT